MWVRVIAAGLGVWLAACGGSEEAPTPAKPAGAAVPAKGENHAPTIESVRIAPPEPGVGDEVRAVVQAHDPDGGRVELGYRWFVDGRELRQGEPSLTLNDVAKGARIGVVVTASDGTLESDSVRAEVVVVDQKPQLEAVELSPSDVVPPGTPVEAVAAAKDPDGDAVDLEYRWWLNGALTQVSGTVFSTNGLHENDSIQVEVRATDGHNWTHFLRSQSVRVGSAHPEITSTPPGFSEDGVFRYSVTAEDPDGDLRLRYRLDEAPAGMVIDEVLGEIAWRPEPDQVGVHPVVVVVKDSSGLETKQSFQVTVRGGDEEAPPASNDEPAT